MRTAGGAGRVAGPALVGLSKLVAGHCAAGDGWQTDDDDDWLRVSHGEAAAPPQGWKLHISAKPGDAADVLRAVLPVLASQPVTFKVAASADQLTRLNLGLAGRSQVGKFITVYPKDDRQAVLLAARLDRATQDWRGPKVPTDRRLRPDSLVSYRYGAFDGRWMQTPTGGIVPALETPEGDLVPDHRARLYLAPDWAEDPFVAAGLVVDPPPASLLIRDRYLLTSVLTSTAEGSVHLALDLVSGDRCVVKRARRHAGGIAGSERNERLHHEADLLERLSDDPAVPTLIEYCDDADNHYLVMERVVGRSLETVVADAAVKGFHLGIDQVIRHVTAAAQVVARLHARGFLHGDLKPAHVFVVDDGVRLVDIESLWDPDEPSDLQIMGTPGYASPQRLSGHPLEVADDIYAFGALLYFTLTATEPSQSPDRRNVLGRPIELLRPDTPPSGLVTLVHRCLAHDPAERPSSMREVITALEQASTRSGPHMPRLDATAAATATGEGQNGRDWLESAQALADDICAQAVPAPEGTGLAWQRTVDDQPAERDLGSGAGGVIWGLAEVAGVLDDDRIHELIAGTARWLAASEPLPGGPLPGLYVGEGGIAAALLKAGEVLGDGGLTDRGLELAELVATLPYISPDLYNGLAGRVRFHLLAWQSTGEAANLDHALAAAQVLAERALLSPDGTVRWVIPAGHEGPEEQAYFGYAHGLAGIADVLIDVVQLTGDKGYLPLVEAAVATLARTAHPMGHDDQGCTWPDGPEGEMRQPLWCHGGGGITRFLDRAGKLLNDETPLELGRRVRVTMSNLRMIGPCQCHGLAGSVETMLDAADYDPLAALMAPHLGRLMRCFLVPPDDLFPPSQLALRDDSLMTGRAGVLRCLARLARPDLLGPLLAVPERADR